MASDSEVQVTYAVGDYNVEGKKNAPARLRVSRAVYDQASFDSTYGLCEPGAPMTPWENVKRVARKKWRRTKSSYRCSGTSCYGATIRWLPIIDWMRKYDIRGNLVTDIIAGITVGVLNVPQGMAYALLASCPPVTGLYTSFFPVIVYLLMGTSRQCSIGTFSIISMMTSKIVHDYRLPEHYFNDTHIDPKSFINGTKYTPSEWNSIQTASTVALMSGIWQEVLLQLADWHSRTRPGSSATIFGLVGLGGLAVYLSDQLVQGFICGASFHVFTSQLKSVFGLNMDEEYGVFKIIKTYIHFFKIIGQTQVPVFIVALISFVFLVLVKIGINDNQKIMRKFRGIPVPAELIVVVCATVASYCMNLEKNYHVPIVKKIPEGLPPFTVPNLSIIPAMIGDSISIAIVGLAITVTLGMLYASKHGYSIDPSQEFKAQGMGNLLGCWFQCFPSGASLARSAVQNDVGGRTQLVSLVQCIIVLVFVLTMGRFLEPLPKAALGAIVMVSVFHLLAQAAQLWKLWKLSVVDWSIFLVVFLAVLILDVDIGLGLGVGWAIITVMLRLQKPKVGPLGRLPGTDIYRRTDVYRTAVEVPGIKIVRVDSPIYFANSAYIKQRLYALADILNLVRKYQESHPHVPSELPGVSDHKTNYAYSLNLKLGDEDSAAQDAQEFGSRFGGSTISMEELYSPKKIHTVQTESILVDDDEDIPVKHLIVDCSEICFVDVTGVGFLKKCQAECHNIGVEVLLACTNKPVRDSLYRIDHAEHFKEHQLFVTVHDAVLYAVNEQQYSKANNGAVRAKSPDSRDGSDNGGFVNGRRSRLGGVPEEDESSADELELDSRERSVDSGVNAGHSVNGVVR